MYHEVPPGPILGEGGIRDEQGAEEGAGSPGGRPIGDASAPPWVNGPTHPRRVDALLFAALWIARDGLGRLEAGSTRVDPCIL